MSKQFKITNPLGLYPGQIVFLATDIERHPRIVTNFKIDINNSEQWGLSSGDSFSWHYSDEIILTKDYKL